MSGCGSSRPVRPLDEKQVSSPRGLSGRLDGRAGQGRAGQGPPAWGPRRLGGTSKKSTDHPNGRGGREVIRGAASLPSSCTGRLYRDARPGANGQRRSRQFRVEGLGLRV